MTIFAISFVLMLLWLTPGGQSRSLKGLLDNADRAERTEMVPKNAEWVGELKSKQGACLPGTYRNAGNTTCVECELGTYQSQPNKEYCDVCPTGTSTQYTASTSISQCEDITTISGSPGQRSIAYVTPAEEVGVDSVDGDLITFDVEDVIDIENGTFEVIGEEDGVVFAYEVEIVDCLCNPEEEDRYCGSNCGNGRK